MRVLVLNPPQFHEKLSTLRDEICFQDVPYTPFPLRLGRIAGILREGLIYGKKAAAASDTADPDREVELDIKAGDRGTAGEKHEVRAIDATAEKLSFDELEARLKNLKNEGWAPEIMIFQSAAGLVRQDCRAADLTKKIFPDCRTILIEAVVAPIYPERFLGDFPSVDFIIRGRFERIIPNILAALPDASAVPGAAGRRPDGSIFTNDADPGGVDLTEMPMMAYDLFPMKKYSMNFVAGPLRMKTIPGIMIRTTHSCPYKCPFCIIGSSPKRGYDGRWYAASVDRAVDEIEFVVKNYGLRGFHFWDETFTLDKKRSEEFCDEINRRGLKIIWRCLTRIDALTENLVRKMAKAGCRHIEFGIEAGNEEVRKKLHKYFDDETCRKVTKWCRDAGIQTHADMIVGMPWETRETLKDSENLAKTGGFDIVHLTRAFPYPDSEFYRIAERDDLLLVKDLYPEMLDARVRVGKAERPVVRTYALSPDEMEAGWREIRRNIDRDFFLRMVLARPGSWPGILADFRAIPARIAGVWKLFFGK